MNIPKEASDFLSELASKAEPLVASLADLVQDFSQPVRAKLLLVINHVIYQEPEAVRRLSVYAGRKVMLESPLGNWLLNITPAGLLEEGTVAKDTQTQALEHIDLRLKVRAPDLKGLTSTLLKGERPPVDIEGDADLAAAFAWLGENLRWDYAEDLSRIIGDAPTHIALEQLRAGVGLFRGFLESVSKRFNRFDE